MQVKVKKVHEDAVVPQYARAGDAGADLRSVENVAIANGERGLIPTGIAIELPFGHEAQIRSKSGITYKQGVIVGNSPGTIDEGYRGEIKVILFNLSGETFCVKKGDKIGQMVIKPVEQADFLEVDELSDSERGEGGFGSTGIQ
jgi:dUTP pyrophosphatase